MTAATNRPPAVRLSTHHEETFGPYRLLECLGVGGMATVHRAVHVETGREVAIKRLLPQLADDRALAGQFIREARISCALRHRNIVGVHHFGRVDGVAYIEMEFVSGMSVFEVLRRQHALRRPAPAGVVLGVLRQVLNGLAYAASAVDDDGHPLSVIHRDISPSNLLVTADGVVKIIDFGIAKATAGRYTTETGRVKGKFGYMAPEAFEGSPVDHRADIFSTAVVAWELLTARRLYSGSERQQIALRAKRVERTPPSHHNDACPAGVDDLLAIALRTDPEERWPSAEAMLTAVEAAAHGLSGPSSMSILGWTEELESLMAEVRKRVQARVYAPIEPTPAPAVVHDDLCATSAPTRDESTVESAEWALLHATTSAS